MRRRLVIALGLIVLGVGIAVSTSGGVAQVGGAAVLVGLMEGGMALWQLASAADARKRPSVPKD